MLRIKSGIIRSYIFAVCMFLVPALCSAAPGSHYSTEEHYSFSIGGLSSGFLKSVNGGAISSKVDEIKVGSQAYPKKQLSQLKYEDLAIEMGIPVSPEMSNWIAATWADQAVSKDCIVTRSDFNYQAKNARQYLGSLITETTIPACDGSAKEPGYLTVTLSPEEVKDVQGATPTNPADNTSAQKKQWSQSDFKLVINGLDCTKVARIDSFTVKQEITIDKTSEVRIDAKHPVSLIFPNLRITIPESNAQTWKDWFNDFAIMGNNKDGMEKSGTLTLFSANGVDKLIEIKFEHLGIFRLESISGDADSPMPRIVADLYCEHMIWVTSGATQESLPSDDGSRRKTSSSAGQSGIVGLWKVTQGTEENHHIYMYQEGGKIAGMWDDRTIITGSMNGNVFKGEYHGTVNPNGNAITMTLADDGLSFEGMYHSSILDRPIRGVKDVDTTAKIKATPTAGASDVDFYGTWGTTAGDIILTQDGGKVGGTWGDKTINGAVKGNVLNGRYYSTRYPELIWDFNMTMRPDEKTCILFHTSQGGVLINTWRK